MSGRTTKSPTMNTEFDDWETDPDFIRDMDETDQRWGSRRTVGSINMNELIDEVRRDHRKMREKFDHPSQRDYSEGFGGKFGIQHDRKDPSAHDYDYHEKLSKHTSQEISHKVIKSTSSSFIKDGDGAVSDAKRTFLKSEKNFETSSSPNKDQKPDFVVKDKFPFQSANLRTELRGEPNNPTGVRPKVFEESSTKKFYKEDKSSSSAAREPGDIPQAFKSIQDKIDAFKKEFEETENKVAKKSDLSKVIKKTTNFEKSSNVQYVTRSDGSKGSTTSTPMSFNNRPTSTSPLEQRDLPKTNIKSLSKKFETLYREDDEDFKRRTEARRKEFFDQIKSQVRETRKGLDGFDPIDSDDDFSKSREKLRSISPNQPGVKQSKSKSPSSPYSRLSSVDVDASNKPKVYTKRETTQEEYVSKVVKENDKVVVNESKRNVERSSSCHGSSDEDEPNDGHSSIKFLDKELRSSQGQRVDSPIDEVKRKVPIVEPQIKGAGLMARTLYDYQAEEDDELSFDVDDLITNIEKIDSGWYRGIITKAGHKKLGLFPANYVKLLNDSSEY